jgi:hypothetical protein
MFRHGSTTVEFLNNSHTYCYPCCMDKELTNLRLVAAQAAAAGMAIIKEWRESGRDIQALRRAAAKFGLCLNLYGK